MGNWRCLGCRSPQFLSVEEIKYRCLWPKARTSVLIVTLLPIHVGDHARSLSAQQRALIVSLCAQCSVTHDPDLLVMPKLLLNFVHVGNTQRCSELKSAKSCGQVCGHQLQCGRHYCQKICHEGPCGRCDTLLIINCFYGRKRETMACGTMG